MAAATRADGWDALSCMISASVLIASGVNFSQSARTSGDLLDCRLLLSEMVFLYLAFFDCSWLISASPPFVLLRTLLDILANVFGLGQLGHNFPIFVTANHLCGLR